MLVSGPVNRRLDRFSVLIAESFANTQFRMFNGLSKPKPVTADSD